MFNALKYTQELEKAGFTREQAEATLNMIHGFAENNLATKQDVLELKHSFETLEYKLTLKCGGMLVVAIGVIVSLVKLL